MQLRTRWLPLLLAAISVSASAEVKFSVTYPAEAFSGPFTGRVVVYLTKGNRDPRFGPNWFNPEPMYSAMFKNVKPGEKMVISDANCVGFPGKLADLASGEWGIQAVVDRNLGGREIGGSPGNLYSLVKKSTIGSDGTVDLVCDQVVAEQKFRESERIKEVRIRSALLSKFYGMPFEIKAAVVLPKEYATDPNRKFPVLYSIPGFGGTHMGTQNANPDRSTAIDGEPVIFVNLDPSCPLGHSVFADSANNGPWGKALTTELIPEIEKRYRAIPTAQARLLTGHSSGGWSSLWLQVAYPDFFGGTWSTSPDPVDFRDFQRIDIYAKNANAFTDPAGQARPLARQGERILVLYKQFSDMERPIRGEQLGSFDAVFSERGPDGQPKQLWNRVTGAIDPKVAESWKKYDIGLILRTHWKTLEPKLKGKLHVYMGNEDTFYLDGAVRLLKKDMEAMGADAKIEMFPGDHGSVMTLALRQRIAKEMGDTIRAIQIPKGNSR